MIKSRQNTTNITTPARPVQSAFLQRTTAPSSTRSSLTTGIPPIIHQTLRSHGQPLDSSTRAFMEPRFGHDFSKVRIHSDFKASESAQAINARAYTVGNDMVFGGGQYSPNTLGGRTLLGHELTHVVQQKQFSAGTLLQRAITVVDPGDPTPNFPAMTNAEIVETWIDTLCGAGNWAVDPTTGVVDSPDRATFCANRPTPGQAHFSTSGTPTSCTCICELTAPGSNDVFVHAANAFTIDGNIVDVNAYGEGVTILPGVGRPGYNVGISGLSRGVPGVGDTSPVAGTNPSQTIRVPPWINFAHEVCGHARLATAQTGAVHAQTPEGDLTAIDIANRVRREHSTITSSWGITRGRFRDALGTQHEGSFYRVTSGETLSGIAVRCGLTQAEILTRIFRENGDAVTAATQHSIAVNERLLIDGIFWHEVISGENMSLIASFWGIPLASLKRANPSIVAPYVIHPGDRLLVPAR